MNGTLSQLSKTNMKTTFNSAPVEFYNSLVNTKDRLNGLSVNYYDPNDNIPQSSTLKGKVQNLDDQLSATAAEIDDHRKDVKGLELEKLSLQETIELKGKEVKNTLMQELDKLEEELKNHFSAQIAENGRMLKQINALKTEKTALTNELIALQRRMMDLEQQVGNMDLKYKI
ncbi:MAG: hypothetical protein MJ252_00460 [archaeon]|nr:hypothetical protein [archaeon]